MAEIDASIATKVQPPTFDPLKTVGSAVQLGQGLLQNKLLGQQVNSKIALGKAVTAATDPETGQTDWNKALGSLSQDPQGSFAVPELAGQVLDRKLKELNISAADLSNSATRWAKTGDWASSLISDKAPLSPQAVAGSAKDVLLASGLFKDPHSQELVTNFITNLPADDAGIRERLKQLYMMSGDNAQRIAAMLGTPETVNTGSQQIQQQRAPLTGETRVSGVVENTRTPGEKAAMVQVWDPAKQAYVLKPSGSVLGDMAPGALPAAGGGGSPPQAAPALGEPEAAAQAAGQAQGLRVAAEKVPENKAALQNIRDTINSFQPGAKTNWTYAVNALATQMGVASPKVASETAAQEEFNKLATQFINSQVGALGGTGTDAKLESARHGSPNEFMSRLGIQNVTGLMLGLNDAVGAKNEAWQKWLDAGNAPGTYGKFQTEFNRYYNPRVFQSVYMTDAQRQNMLSQMGKDDRAQFQRDWIFAKKAGWIK